MQLGVLLVCLSDLETHLHHRNRNKDLEGSRKRTVWAYDRVMPRHFLRLTKRKIQGYLSLNISQDNTWKEHNDVYFLFFTSLDLTAVELKQIIFSWSLYVCTALWRQLIPSNIRTTYLRVKRRMFNQLSYRGSLHGSFNLDRAMEVSTAVLL